MNKLTEILALIQERYECDECVARAILGTRIHRSQSQVKYMEERQGSAALSTTEKLKEAEEFFTESSDEVLGCPYIPAGDTIVNNLSAAFAYLGGKIAFYEKLWPIKGSMDKLRKRFAMEGEELIFADSGKSVKDSGKYVRIYTQDAKKKVWKQRRTEKWPMEKGDELYPSRSRIIDLLTDNQEWLDEYKVDYYGREFSGLELTDEGNVRIVLPVRICSAHKGLNEDVRVTSIPRPFDATPLTAAYAAWVYKMAGYARPNKPLTDLRPDQKLVSYLTNNVRVMGDTVQRRIDTVLASSRKFGKKS